MILDLFIFFKKMNTDSSTCFVFIFYVNNLLVVSRYFIDLFDVLLEARTTGSEV